MFKTKTQWLPDHIRHDVRLLFVGINPGLRSAEIGHHYAGHSNRFWKLLHEAHLVPIPLSCQDDWRLPEWGYGLTNLIDRPTSGIQELTPSDYSEGKEILLDKVYRFRPQLVVLLGLTIRDALFPHQGPAKTKSRPPVGLQPYVFGEVPVFVLPNPSGRNAHYSFHAMRKLFRQLYHLSRKMETSNILPDAVSRRTTG